METIQNTGDTLLTRLYNYQQLPNDQNPGEPDEGIPEGENGINLSITPSDDNAPKGEDRSQNSVAAELTTPNNEFSAEITREEAVDRYEQRAKRNAIERAFDIPAQDGPSPILVGAAAAGKLPDDIQEAAVGAAQLKYVRNVAEYAFEAANDNNGDNSSTDNNNGTDSFADFANEALAMQRKQAKFAYVVDKTQSMGNYVDTVA